MLGENHLKLRLVRLKPSELWDPQVRSEDELALVFLKGGGGQYISQNSSQRLMGGDILAFSGAAGVKVQAAEKNDCLFSTFSLAFEHLFPLFATGEISSLHNVISSFKSPKLYPKSSGLAADCQRLADVDPAQSTLEHRGHLLRIVAAVLAGEFKNAQSQRGGFGRPEDHMIQVFEKLSSAELLNLSVEELAVKFSCSRRHLNRLFHQHFGLSIAALRMEIRLLKAVSLLRDPHAKVINVAEQCGFNHLGLFNTCFKRRYGTSPGQWRKQMLAAERPAIQKGEQPKQICPLHANGLCPWGSQLDASGQSTRIPPSERMAALASNLAISSRRDLSADARTGQLRNQP